MAARESDSLEFVSLWTSHAPRVYAFIFSLVPNFADADDVLQETSVVLMRKFAEFQPGSNFFAWACRTAYLEVLESLRRHRAIEHLDESLLERVQVEAMRSIDQPDRHADALSACLEKLAAKDRRLITLRYHNNRPAAEVARTVGRSVSAVHKALARIHESLLDCIRRQLSAEGRE